MNTEFKMLLSVDLVVNYICAFLNSTGGKLYIGVTDEGIVRGISLNRK